MSYYRQQLESWLSELDVHADLVLDIGGIQLPVKDRVKSWDVKEYKVLDLPEYDMNEHWIISPNKKGISHLADVIFCLEVFEYLYNPYYAMANISDLLKYSDQGDGKAYITFPLVYPTHNELDLDSLRYTEAGIKRLAEKTDLKVTNVWYRIDKSGLLQQFYAADGMHPSKEYAHHNATGFIVEVQRV